jgi:hypothetical protein
VLSSQPLPAFVGVPMPAGVAQSVSTLLALTIGLTVAIPLLSQLQALATSFLEGEKLTLSFRAQLFPFHPPMIATGGCAIKEPAPMPEPALPVRIQRAMLPTTPLQGFGPT